MKCDRAALSDYRDGELSPRRKRALEGHLSVCGECRKVLGDYEGIARAVRALPRYEASDALARDVYQRIRAERQGVGSRFGRQALLRFGSLAAVAAIIILVAATTFRNAPTSQPGLQAPMRAQDRDVAERANIPDQDRDVAGPAPRVAAVEGLEPGEPANSSAVIFSQSAPGDRERQVAEAPVPAALATSTPGPGHEPATDTGQPGREKAAEDPKAIVAQVPAKASPGSPAALIALATVQAPTPVLAEGGPAPAVAVSTPKPGGFLAQVPAVATPEFTGTVVPGLAGTPTPTPTPRLFSIVASVEITRGPTMSATEDLTRGMAITTTTTVELTRGNVITAIVDQGM